MREKATRKNAYNYNTSQIMEEIKLYSETNLIEVKNSEKDIIKNFEKNNVVILRKYNDEKELVVGKGNNLSKNNIFSIYRPNKYFERVYELTSNMFFRDGPRKYKSYFTDENENVLQNFFAYEGAYTICKYLNENPSVWGNYDNFSYIPNNCFKKIIIAFYPYFKVFNKIAFLKEFMRMLEEGGHIYLTFRDFDSKNKIMMDYELPFAYKKDGLIRAIINFDEFGQTIFRPNESEYFLDYYRKIVSMDKNDLKDLRRAVIDVVKTKIN